MTVLFDVFGGRDPMGNPAINPFGCVAVKEKGETVEMIASLRCLEGVGIKKKEIKKPSSEEDLEKEVQNFVYSIEVLANGTIIGVPKERQVRKSCQKKERG